MIVNIEAKSTSTSYKTLISEFKMRDNLHFDFPYLLKQEPHRGYNNSCKVFLMYIRSQRIVNTSVMPLGILYVASLLEQHGFDVRVFDTLFENSQSAVEEVRTFQPDVIGLSFLTTEYKLAKEWINQLRTVCPGALYIAGGPHISSSIGQRAAEELELDFAVYAEGEATALELCRRIRANRDTRDARGIYWRNEKGKMIKNPPMPLIDNLDLLPHPARHLLKKQKYLAPPGHIRSHFTNGTLTLLSSRGCHAHCTFCDSHITFGRRVRRRSVENVIEEIEEARSFLDFESIYFFDDTFTLNHEWVYHWCNEIKKLNIPWGCETRVTSVNRALLNKMKDSGCVQVDYGVESGSPKVLKAMRKCQTREQIIRTFDQTRAAGLRTFATMMVGFPEEQVEELELSINLVKRIKPNFLHVTCTTPFPGTELYDLAIRNGWLDEGMCEELDWDIVNSEEPILQVNLTGDELKRNRRRLQNANFFRNYISIFSKNNMKYILRSIIAVIKRPKELAEALKVYMKTQNMDVLLIHFYKQYQVEFLRSQRSKEAIMLQLKA